MPYKFTEQEKEELRQQYIEYTNTINRYLDDDCKIKLDMNAFNKKINDPKQAWLYKKGLEVKAREIKKKEIQDILTQKYNHLKDPRKAYELDRVMHTDLIPSDDPEAMAYNDELIKQYILHPEAMTQYRFQKVLNSKVDIPSEMSQCNDLESLMLLYSEKNPTYVEDSCSMVAALERAQNFRLLTPEMKQYLKPVCGNYENIIDSSNFFKKINTGYFTVPHSLTQKQDMVINGTSFETEQAPLAKLLNENLANNVEGVDLNKGFKNYFKWLKDNNVNVKEEGALTKNVIYAGNQNSKPVSMSAYVANKKLNYDGVNPIKVELPANTVNGIKKIFVEDFTKEPGFKIPTYPAKFKEPAWKASRDELIFQYAIKHNVPVHELDNGGISKIAEHISGNLKERMFNTTSLEYKNFITTLKNYDNEKHVGYHNSMPVKIAANQYLLHKGVTSREQAERLPYPAKDRALLCFDVIETFQKNEGPEVEKLVPGTQQRVPANVQIQRVQAIEDPKLVADEFEISVSDDKAASENSVEYDNEIHNENELK